MGAVTHSISEFDHTHAADLEQLTEPVVLVEMEQVDDSNVEEWWTWKVRIQGRG